MEQRQRRSLASPIPGRLQIQARGEVGAGAARRPAGGGVAVGGQRQRRLARAVVAAPAPASLSVNVGFGNAAAARPGWSSTLSRLDLATAARSVASTPDGSRSAGRLSVGSGKRRRLAGMELAASLLFGWLARR